MWMLDMKKYQSIQHQRRRLNVIFGNGLRQLGVREENNPVKGRARSLIYSGSKLRSSPISRGRRGRSRRILPGRPDCLNGISKICWKIDSRANVRTDTQPPGQGSEPHLDFVVTDLDGMLAQLCGPGALGCGRGFRAARLQSNFAVLTSHVSARLGSRQENSAARLPERIFQEC
jgi:hypothetical protein